MGNSPLEYAVEYAPPSLRGDSDIETDVELLRVENPTGHVPAFGSADIRMRFLPLQAASYESAFKIRYKYGDRGSTRHGELDALLTCAGYDPRDASQDPHKGGKVPEGSTSTNYEYQIVEAPAQPAVLSRECVDYGRVAQRAHVIRMVTLRAPKALEAEGRPPIYEFQWEAAHDLIEKGILGVEPLSGRILPGGVAVCRVSLKADCEPRVVDASLLVLVKEAAPTPAMIPSETRLVAVAPIKPGSAALAHLPRHAVVLRLAAARVPRLVPRTRVYNTSLVRLEQ